MLVPPYLFFNDTATSELSTLSLHDALPICQRHRAPDSRHSHPTRALAHRGLSHTAHSRSRSPLILVSVTRHVEPGGPHALARRARCWRMGGGLRRSPPSACVRARAHGGDMV